MKPVANHRLMALDVMRGITIAGMILVNNPGNWNYVYAPLEHAAWNGLTPTDLVFPFFMFIMGISTYLSLQKYNFKPNQPLIWKIIRRTLVIFAIGLAIGWFSRFCFRCVAPGQEQIPLWQRLAQAAWNFDTMRTLGVLQRLALCYGAAALIGIYVQHRYIVWIIAGGLAGYAALLILGNGFEHSELSLLSLVDRTVLGSQHIYRDGGIAFDPEGILSTIPSICHVLIGFCIGKIIAQSSQIPDKLLKLFRIGSILMLAGWILSYGCPINKKIWSPTFVLVTCGMGASLLALLIRSIDMKGHKQWGRFFESFGVNPLFIYALSAVLAILLGAIRIPDADGMISLHGWIYAKCLQPLLGNYCGSLTFALLFVALNWAVGHVLYKKKIFIKI